MNLKNYAHGIRKSHQDNRRFRLQAEWDAVLAFCTRSRNWTGSAPTATNLKYKSTNRCHFVPEAADGYNVFKMVLGKKKMHTETNIDANAELGAILVVRFIGSPRQVIKWSIVHPSKVDREWTDYLKLKLNILQSIWTINSWFHACSLWTLVGSVRSKTGSWMFDSTKWQASRLKIYSFGYMNEITIH